MLKAIRQNEAAALDAELRATLHHILLANRFWLSLFLGIPFDLDAESKIPDSLAELSTRYHETYRQEIEWISRIGDADLERTVETTFMPGQQYSVAQGIMQVCMHTQAHRAQCATRLRLLGGIPPPMDFVIWLKDRPEPDWL
jgi:uncharacterized damage-inducible protein DinB